MNILDLNQFIHDAKIMGMLFDPKSNDVGVFLENELHAPPNGQVGSCDLTKWTY